MLNPFTVQGVLNIDKLYKFATYSGLILFIGGFINLSLQVLPLADEIGEWASKIYSKEVDIEIIKDEVSAISDERNLIQKELNEIENIIKYMSVNESRLFELQEKQEWLDSQSKSLQERIMSKQQQLYQLMRDIATDRAVGEAIRTKMIIIFIINAFIILMGYRLWIQGSRNWEKSEK